MYLAHGLLPDNPSRGLGIRKNYRMTSSLEAFCVFGV
jgi:hypothetical protein